MNIDIMNVWIILGFIIIAVGVIILLNQFTLRRSCTEKTQGLIVMGDFNNGEETLMLTFKANGVKYREPFAGSKRINMGSKVTVVYNPNNTKNKNRVSYYILEDSSNLKKVIIICFIAGVISIFYGYAATAGWF